jgi:hypothetical protein
MSNKYSFLIHSDIMHALNKHNNIIPGERLTFLDGALLCFIKSFQDRQQKFYMSNKELGKLFISNESTIQRSINRLISMKLLSSEKVYCGQQPRRYLTYSPEVLKNISELK